VGGLLNVKVVFSVRVCKKFVPSLKFTVVALEEELTVTASSCIPPVNLTTLLASADTTLEAAVLPSVVKSN
jgi:hypothetical protein